MPAFGPHYGPIMHINMTGRTRVHQRLVPLKTCGFVRLRPCWPLVSDHAPMPAAPYSPYEEGAGRPINQQQSHQVFNRPVTTSVRLLSPVPAAFGLALQVLRGGRVRHPCREPRGHCGEGNKVQVSSSGGVWWQGDSAARIRHHTLPLPHMV
jgi:hypothetical protein